MKKYLIIMTGATFVGLVVLVGLTTVVLCLLDPLIEIIFHPKPPSIQGDPGA
jgi:hypothetical protein